MAQLAEVVTMRDRSLCDVPAMLLQLADDIRSGKWGEVECCAVSLLGSTLEVFAFGPHSSGPSAHLVLRAGAQKLEDIIIGRGK